MPAADLRILFLGSGDLGTGAVHRLVQSGFVVAILELASPHAVRRRVAFAEAARTGAVEVEGLRCRRIDLGSLERERQSFVPLVVAPLADVLAAFGPQAIVDARMTKQPITDALPPGVFRIALGPGHTAGVDCDAVVETLRGPDLGKVLWSGEAAPDTHTPGELGGETARRVLRSPADGTWAPNVAIGAHVERGDVVGHAAGVPVQSELTGLVRGLLAPGVRVTRGQKLGDIDPRRDAPAIDRISDKSHRVGAGVLEALATRFDRPLPPG